MCNVCIWLISRPHLATQPFVKFWTRKTCFSKRISLHLPARDVCQSGSSNLWEGARTRSGKERTRSKPANTDDDYEAMEDLGARVEELQQEAQNAIEASDQELKRVSAECESLSSEACGVRDLAKVTELEVK